MYNHDDPVTDLKARKYCRISLKKLSEFVYET